MAGEPPVSPRALLAGALRALAPTVARGQGQRLRIALAGLAHNHDGGSLRALESRVNVDLEGVSAPDSTFRAGYADRFRPPGSSLFASLEEMLEKTRPHAVSAFPSTDEYPLVVEACAFNRLPPTIQWG